MTFKQYLIIHVITLFFIGACRTSKDLDPPGSPLRLYARSFNTDIYVRLNSDTAFLFWFYEEHWPRTSRLDTLVRHVSSTDLKWSSDSFEVIYNNGKFHVRFYGPYKSPRLKTARLKNVSTGEWENDLNKNLNFFLIRKYYVRYVEDKAKDAGRVKLWNELSKERRLNEHAGRISHTEFVKLCADFIAEFLDKTKNSEER